MAARQASTTDEIPELPRAAAHLVGHEDAEAVLESAFRSGRLAHAWLISGPRGVGKATLAYRFARFVLANGGGGGAMSLGLGLEGPPGLAMAPESDVFRRVAALAHGNLRSLEFEINPETKRMRTEIVVDQVRRLIPFFGLTAAESGWRIAVIDSADDLNASAANALLKILEEPPDKALLLLTANQPGRILATIRSRCRELHLRPLAEAAMSRFLADRMPGQGAEERATLARLAGGSPGRALRLGALDGIELYAEMVGLLAGLPGRLDILTLHRLGDRMARRGQEDAYKILIDFFTSWLARLVRGISTQQSGDEIVAGEGEAMRKLAAARPLDEWIGVWEKVSRFVARADEVNLDRKQVVLYVFSAVDPAAR
jgi:DNA polymerase-3 subunit delta'